MSRLESPPFTNHAEHAELPLREKAGLLIPPVPHGVLRVDRREELLDGGHQKHLITGSHLNSRGVRFTRCDYHCRGDGASGEDELMRPHQDTRLSSPTIDEEVALLH